MATSVHGLVHDGCVSGCRNTLSHQRSIHSQYCLPWSPARQACVPQMLQMIFGCCSASPATDEFVVSATWHPGWDSAFSGGGFSIVLFSQPQRHIGPASGRRFPGRCMPKHRPLQSVGASTSRLRPCRVSSLCPRGSGGAGCQQGVPGAGTPCWYPKQWARWHEPDAREPGS